MMLTQEQIEAAIVNYTQAYRSFGALVSCLNDNLTKTELRVLNRTLDTLQALGNKLGDMLSIAEIKAGIKPEIPAYRRLNVKLAEQSLPQ